MIKLECFNCLFKSLIISFILQSVKPLLHLKTHFSEKSESCAFLGTKTTKKCNKNAPQNRSVNDPLFETESRTEKIKNKID